jgi:hypothetical protein
MNFPKLNIAKFLNDDEDIITVNIYYENKQINNKIENDECFILNKKIEQNNLYLSCKTCSKNYLYNEYFKINNSCPFCKKSILIDNKLKIFINK